MKYWGGYEPNNLNKVQQNIQTKIDYVSRTHPPEGKMITATVFRK